MFMFDLEVDDPTGPRARAVADACRARGAWPVSFVEGRVERRWFGIQKSYPSVLEIPVHDEHGPILAPTAARDADSLDLRPDALPRLAAALRIIAEHFDEFVFRATFSGSPIQIDRDPTAEELATLVERQQLNEFTRYRVKPG